MRKKQIEDVTSTVDDKTTNGEYVRLMKVDNTFYIETITIKDDKIINISSSVPTFIEVALHQLRTKLVRALF